MKGIELPLSIVIDIAILVFIFAFLLYVYFVLPSESGSSGGADSAYTCEKISGQACKEICGAEDTAGSGTCKKSLTCCKAV